ncbi:MAG: M24 family metallopeptidase [Holosporaceae bacterium]|jgi:Xaa-Pro aminopeptidase|nr:M24 family metallopeptidase [Holosporaceae bacterium]
MKSDPLKNDEAVFFRKSSRNSLFEESAAEIFRSLSGLEASDGVVILSRKKSAIFVDGRYALAAKRCVNQKKFEILKLKNAEIIKWMEENLPQNHKISYDPAYCTLNESELLSNRFSKHKFIETDLKKTLNIRTTKRDPDIYRIPGGRDAFSPFIRETIEQNNLDAYLICDPCIVCRILHIRDLGQKYTPVLSCKMLITRNSEKILYADEKYNPHPLFKSEKELSQDLAKYSRIGTDKSRAESRIKHRGLIDVNNLLALPCSVKNEAEIEDMKTAAQKDSIALINFLYDLHRNGAKITESEAAESLLRFRKRQDGFIGESFPAIAAADENSAIVHHVPDSETTKTVEKILLIDSGGQYKNGTTDITRTVSVGEPTAEQKFFYTLVLKGHIALADAKFPAGTGGNRLDSLARQFLWRHSADYDHSTGHGIGYMLHVHEGPAAISVGNGVPLQPGMILSDEPGYYRENAFGIRLENMMLTKEAGDGSLCFETLSLVPFDAGFIDKNLLTEEEIRWLKKYNETIMSSLKLDDDVFDWLLNCCIKDFRP